MKRRTLLATAAMPRSFAIAQPARVPTPRFVPQAVLTLLDPIFTTALVTINHGWAIHDTRFGANNKQEPQPQMAEGYTVSDDGRTYLIKLREGLKFHAGEPVRAQDAAPSLKRWAALETIGQTVAKFVEDWSVQDDRTIKITMTQRLPNFIEAIGKDGWNILHTWAPSIVIDDPVKQWFARGLGSTGWFGWCKDDDIEQLTQTPADQNAAADAFQRRAFDNVPFVPIGQFQIRTAYRKNLTGLIEATGAYFWNIRRT